MWRGSPAWACGLALVWLAQEPRPSGPPVRSGLELVSLPVTVLTRSGEVVPGLGPEDFEITENGHRQQLASFSAAGLDAMRPYHLGLMLDKSASMERDRDAATAAVVKLVTHLAEAVDVTFVEFDSRVEIGRFEPANYLLLFERIRRKPAGHGTALYDAVGRYAQIAGDRAGLHILVVYSDGADSQSRLSLGETMDLLRQGHVLLYAVGYLEHQPSGSRFVQQSVLTRLARETGGEAFFPASTRDIDRIYGNIAAEIQGRYLLGYVSSDRRKDGKFRRTEVRLTRPDLKHLRLRTRSGYLAPGGAETTRVQ
jgi:Ca-activated chloride channel family protein